MPGHVGVLFQILGLVADAAGPLVENAYGSEFADH